MKFNTLKELVDFRIMESEENYWVEEYWKIAVNMLSEDIFKTILFIQNECTDEEFFWVTEILEDVVKKTQSVALINACRNRLALVIPENYNKQNFLSEHMRKWVDYKEFVRSVSADIDYAEGQIVE